MNKFYTLLILSGAAISAHAQQINGTFAAWNDCIPYDSKGGTNVCGIEPNGWHVSNVYVTKGISCKIASQVTGRDGEENGAVKLTNGNMVANGIPAYMTLGTPYATAEGMAAKNADGGTFGGKKFTYHPDAISFDYQRDNSNGVENACVIAYLWNGTWTQAETPANTVLSGSANKIDMVDRERNILSMVTSTGGDVTTTDGATRVATINHTIEDGTNGEWKNITIPFTYAEGTDVAAAVENINVIFSANDYFADRKDIKKGNSLTVDNVKLVYYHALSKLTATDNWGYDAELNFDPEVYNYTVDSEYDADWTKVEFTKKGVGASVEAAYDAATAQYVITVKGEDYDEQTNPEAKTVYTIQYVKPAVPAPSLSSLIVAGHEFMTATGGVSDFTATGKYYDNEVSYVVKTDESDTNEITAEKNYDEATGTFTLTLKQEGHPDGVYTIKFEGNEKEAVYQIPNSGFDNWTEDGKLAEAWNSFDTAAGLWSSFASMSPMPEKIEGYEGDGVRIKSKDLWLAYANGNLTTGHINMGNTNPTDASNFNFTDRTDVNGNLPFAGRPDAFEVYARFTPGTKSASAAEDVVLQGRVQLVLHGEAAFHDPFVADQESDKIAVASAVVPATSDWTKFTGEFNYSNDSYDGNMYMLASASTNPVPGASKDDQFDIDNLKLIYYHSLKAITLKGEPIEGFSPEKTEYTINGSIDKLGEYLDYEKMGKGGYVAEDWEAQDDGTFVVTYTVYGDDYDVNPDSKTVYTVRFEKATGIDSVSADEVKNHKVYTIGGVRVSGKPAAGLYIVDGKKMIIK